MQYLLTQEEYDELKAQKRGIRLENTKKLQALCTKIADTMPVNWGWKGPDPKPWGCIITVQREGHEWYCDQCPVQDICPYPGKSYSQ
jgi:hypothetical protein